MTFSSIDMHEYKLYIAGQMTVGRDKKFFDCINPSNGEVFARASDAGRTDIQDAIAAARKAFDQGDWANASVQKRGEYLAKISQLILDHAKELADLETLSTGKTSKQSTFIDVPTCSETFAYFAKAESLLKGSANPVAAPVKSTTIIEPVGVVVAVIPWNYPLIMAAWKIAPALAAGNTVIFKPSSQACASLVKLAQLIHDAGLPKGVFNLVTSTDYQAVEELFTSPLVDMVTFTGGTQTGREIMRLAAGTTKKVSLELGGKSPNIVFKDCDFEAALGGTMSAIFMNQGQMCTACSRLIVEESIAETFVKALVEKTQKLKIGPATHYETDFGPLVSRKQRDDVATHVQNAVVQGAKVLCGGRIRQGDELGQGFYFEPTILGHINPQMNIWKEEVFGPVLCVMTFKDQEEAIKLANDSPYGLASCVWTQDLNKAEIVAKRLQTGTVWINTYGGFYNEASFGGYKNSGFGRELGPEGLLSYTKSKHVCLDQTPGGRPLVSSWF